MASFIIQQQLMLTAIMVERVEKWQAITGFVFQLKCKAFA